MSTALLLLPALAAVVFVCLGWRRQKPGVLAETAPPPASISGEVDPLTALDTLLADVEGATVRIEGADELDERAATELEQLADKLEAAAASLERVR
ncbi:MAG TPA: hypothetical protein VE982_08050 [Gaiellaceae bacterium]|nr:hypothetical protein [Gaiellaceae bacterium]